METELRSKRQTIDIFIITKILLINIDNDDNKHIIKRLLVLWHVLYS